MMRLPQIHSFPASRLSLPCRVTSRLPHSLLSSDVLGYAGFQTDSPGPVAHRLVALNAITLIVDLDSGSGLVTGPRGDSIVHPRAGWRRGVCVALTPAGARALLGVQARELTGTGVRLPDLLGPRAGELIDRLAQAPDWSARCTMLDQTLSGWRAPVRHRRGGSGEAMLGQAWWRLQAGPSRVRVGQVADQLGVSRRYLERGFRDLIGMSPVEVAWVARFQRAVLQLAQGARLPAVASSAGYADQPHFNREVRAMAGLTPTELCAFVQYQPVGAG